jgi:pyruvate dehydrogenase E1 component
LQHQDGHSHVLASTIPNCVAYDPTFGYELAVIIHDGMRRMFVDQENVFYYLTVMNENYLQPAMPKRADVKEGILRGMYLLDAGNPKVKRQVQLLGSGTILREVIAAAELLQDEFEVASDVWSVTSFTELRRDGLDVERWNLLHPEDEPRISFVEELRADRRGPVIAATDYMKIFADQIRPFVRNPYTVLGTDGFGRSDDRKRLRHFFEVNRFFIVVAALKSLADAGEIEVGVVRDAIEKYGIDPDKPNPVTI